MPVKRLYSMFFTRIIFMFHLPFLNNFNALVGPRYVRQFPLCTDLQYTWVACSGNRNGDTGYGGRSCRSRCTTSIQGYNLPIRRTQLFQYSGSLSRHNQNRHAYKAAQWHFLCPKDNPSHLRPGSLNRSRGLGFSVSSSPKRQRYDSTYIY